MKSRRAEARAQSRTRKLDFFYVDAFDPTSPGTVSTLSHFLCFLRPKSEMDYGTLSCMGVNEIGRQRHPCTFRITPASKFDCEKRKKKSSKPSSAYLTRVLI